MNTQTELQKAFVLHVRAYRETSLLVDVLTEKSGRLCVIAKGVRRSKSVLKGLLQPFMPLEMNWRGRGELPTLTNAECCGMPIRLIGNALVSGLYLNELLMRVLHRYDPCESVFQLYQKVINQLKTTQSIQKILRTFEINLLRELGYELQITYEVNSNEKLISEKYYFFLPEQGCLLVENENLASENNYIFLGEHLLAIAENNFDNTKTLSEAKRLMRIALMPLLGNHPLKSLEMLVELYQMV